MPPIITARPAQKRQHRERNLLAYVNCQGDFDQIIYWPVEMLIANPPGRLPFASAPRRISSPEPPLRNTTSENAIDVSLPGSAGNCGETDRSRQNIGTFNLSSIYRSIYKWFLSLLQSMKSAANPLNRLRDPRISVECVEAPSISGWPYWHLPRQTKNSIGQRRNISPVVHHGVPNTKNIRPFTGFG